MGYGRPPATPQPFGRALAIWLGSVLLAGMVLVTCFGMPLAPLLWAGGLTLLVTLIRYVLGRRKP